MRVTLLTLLVLLSPLVSATAIQTEDPLPNDKNWRHIGTSGDGDDYYSIRKTAYGNIVEMWYFSRKSSDLEITSFLEKYNCDSGASKLLKANTYRQNELVSNSSHDDSEWTYALPNTMGAVLVNAACSQRKREWTYVGSTEDKEAYLLKLPSLVRVGDTVRVWVKSAKNEQTISLSLSEYDCAGGRSRHLQTTTYDSTSAPTTSSRVSPWVYAVPDSVGEVVLKAACRANRGASAASKKPSRRRT